MPSRVFHLRRSGSTSATHKVHLERGVRNNVRPERRGLRRSFARLLRQTEGHRSIRPYRWVSCIGIEKRISKEERLKLSKKLRSRVLPDISIPNNSKRLMNLFNLLGRYVELRGGPFFASPYAISRVRWSFPRGLTCPQGVSLFPAL